MNRQMCHAVPTPGSRQECNSQRAVSSRSVSVSGAGTASGSFHEDLVCGPVIAAYQACPKYDSNNSLIAFEGLLRLMYCLVSVQRTACGGCRISLSETTVELHANIS